MKFLISILMFVSGVGAFAKDLTAADLLKGSKIPLRREFPLSEKVSPCEDFHRYVCEKAEKAFKLPQDRSIWFFSFSDSAERILDAKKNYFKKLASGYEPKLERTKNVKRLYLSCMNSAEQKKGEVTKVRTALATMGKIKDRKELLALLSARYFTPEFNFYSLGSEANQTNPVRYDLILGAEGMTLPEQSYYNEDAPVKDLYELARAFFAELKLDQVDRRAEAVVNFEKGLAKVYPVPAEMRKLFSADLYTSRSTLNGLYPHSNLGKAFAQTPERVKIRNLTKDASSYIDSFLGKGNLVDIESVVLFHDLRDFMDDAYPAFFKKWFAFQHKHYGGPPVRPDRQERCTRMAMGSLGKELDAELLNILYPDADPTKPTEVAEAVRATILAGLKKNSWLTESARKEAITKIQSARLMLVKPFRDADWDFLDIQDLSSKDVIQNRDAIANAEYARMKRRLSEDRNRSIWWMSPLTVNAYYTAEDNAFVLPQGVLQYPFFDAKQSRNENLAAMGTVVGHELGHGIDDEGAKYDSNGVLRQWMTKRDLEAFGERGHRLIALFDKAGHNGKLTLGENIGDNVGLEFSLQTAFPTPEEATIEDLKKFFVSYGRLWCSVQRPEVEKVMLKTNPHALGWARINEQVKHKTLFYKAYACKEGDKMYLPPSERVQVW